MRHGREGFTLIEIMVASMIGVFVALVAVGALKAVSVSADMIDDNIEVSEAVRFASKIITCDLMNIYRDRKAENMRLRGAIETSGASRVHHLVIYTVGRVAARGGEPEGDVYEVEYYPAGDENEGFLMRRLWPNPDEESEPGGILSVIAENIEFFDVRYFDGQLWQAEWPEQAGSLPELVEVTIAARAENQAEPIVASSIVNLVRSTARVASEQVSEVMEGGTSGESSETGGEARLGEQ